MKSALVVGLGVAGILEAGLAMASDAKGTLKYVQKGKTQQAEIRYVYLIKGPDPFEPGKKGRDLIFSNKDIGPAIQACDTAFCAREAVTQASVGLTAYFFDKPPYPSGRNFNYNMYLNEELTTTGFFQSGALKTTTDTPNRIAGTLKFDDIGSDERASVDIQFDAPLFKEFAKSK